MRIRVNQKLNRDFGLLHQTCLPIERRQLTQRPKPLHVLIPQEVVMIGVQDAEAIINKEDEDAQTPHVVETTPGRADEAMRLAVQRVDDASFPSEVFHHVNVSAKRQG